MEKSWKSVSSRKLHEFVFKIILILGVDETKMVPLSETAHILMIIDVHVMSKIVGGTDGCEGRWRPS